MRIEVRADGLHISGYVNVTGKLSRPVITPRGKVLETIEERAFAEAIKKSGEERARGDNYTKGKDGKFTGSTSSGGGSSSNSGAGGKSGKSVDKTEKSGKIKKRPKSLRIGKKERERLSHQIATDFPNLKPDGEIHNYENRNHFYRFSVNGLGNYSYHLKIKIVGNEDYINSIRKKGK
jgi:hypothetical protein